MSKKDRNPRVLQIKPPEHRFNYLIAPNGDWLASADGSTMHLQGYVDDQAIWNIDDGGFCHVATGLKLEATLTEIGRRCQLRLSGTDVAADGTTGDASEFIIGQGPEKLPSQYLKSIQQDGYVSLACILSTEIVDRLRMVGCVEEYEGNKPGKVHPIAMDASVSQATIEPVSLWLTQQYMQHCDIRLGHPPSVTSLPPDDGKREVTGWHTDYPYLRGIWDRIGASGNLVLGVQCNTCVSDFKVENGATMFKLGSHVEETGSYTEWGVTNNTVMPGHRKKHGLPYSGEEATVIEAPAGSMVLYDARTWHCAGLNQTYRRRGAMIQAFVPSYIMPFMDTSAAYKAFLESDVINDLNERQLLEIEKLMLFEINGPRGQHAITTDADLTRRLRARETSQKLSY